MTGEGGSAGTAGAGYRVSPPACDLRACRTCTGCAHSGHAACRGTVTCPTDGVTRPCDCCGTSPTTEEASKA